MVRDEAGLEAELDRQSLTVDRKAGEYLADAKMTSAWASYHAGLRRKYERAASHPWESVTPDPPTPEPIPVFQPPKSSKASSSMVPTFRVGTCLASRSPFFVGFAVRTLRDRAI
jgi:hypothetical protein